MRAAWWFFAVAGCGPVRLGDEAETRDLDAGGADVLDAAEPVPEVTVEVRPGAGCDLCFSLQATAAGGVPPYSFEWADGRRDAQRTVCPELAGASMSVVARDAQGHRSAPHVTRLESNDAGCPKPLEVCLQNRSFEGTPGVNSTVAPSFDIAPWSACSNPLFANTPDVVDDSIPQMLTVVPKATDGQTFLGMTEGEQASQRLCESLPGGSEVSVQLDLMRLDISGGVTLNTEQAFLEIWGGVATDCSRRELLWASPPIGETWQTHCVTLRPQQFTDNLTLRASADGTLPTVIYVLADRLQPVSRCP